MRCEVTLLGPFTVAVDGAEIPTTAWRHRRAKELVKILCLAEGHRMMAEQLIELLWQDLSPEAGRANLRKAAHLARSVLGAPDSVVLGDGRVAFWPSGDLRVDVEVFESVAADALGSGDEAKLASAIGLYTGDLLPEDRYEDWAAEHRDITRRKFLELLRRAGMWQRLAEEEPLDEEARRALMRSWLDRGVRHAALREFIQLRDLLARELGVRPSPETIAVWEEVKEAIPAPAVAPMRLTGRDDELALALKTWDSARAGHGGVLLVSGEAGIGKTRFCGELLQVARADEAVTITAVARPEDASSPFGVMLTALEASMVDRPDLEASLYEAARSHLAGARSPVGSSSWIVAPMPGIERQRLFSAMAQIVSVAAADHGLVMVVEDLHNADDGSLQLLSYLGRSAGHQRVLLVLSHRSETLSPQLADLRGVLLEQRAVDVRLSPLDLEATAALVSEMSEGRATKEAVEAIWGLAGGIPFYIEELATSIDAAGHVQVPDRLYEVLRGRLDGLEPGLREALQTAAVAGDRFTSGELAAVLGIDELATYELLDRAIESGVIVEDGTGYQFRHALVRRALERSLPRHVRQRIHEDTAARLAVTGAEPAMVAYHLLAAGRDQPAVPWLEKAAVEAGALGAYSDGLRLATDAAARAEPGDRARLLALRADMLYATGDAAAVAAYDLALATAQPETRARLWVMKARAFLAGGQVEEAKQALDWAEPTEAADRIAKLVVLGLVSWAGGAVEAAEQSAREARDLAIEAGDTNGLAEATELLGLVAHSRGEWRDRIRYELTDTLKRPEEVAGSVFDAHLCLAEYLLYGQQPYEQVIDFARDLKRAAARSGAERGEAFATCVLGEAELLAGRIGEAEADLERAAVLHEKVGAFAGQALSLQRLGEAALAAGDLQRAAALLDQAEMVSQGSSLERHLVGKVYGAMVRCAPDAESAMSVVDRAEARMSGQPVCEPCAIGFYVAASIAASRAADTARSERYLTRAQQVSSRWPGGGWHGAVLEARAELAVAEGRVDDAARLFEQAAATFEGAGQPLDAGRCRANAVSSRLLPT
jgi:DNA-binding SARP family transcriptional activator/tetratricopeptide (TPR) repeat protein